MNTSNISPVADLYGLVICGGNSSRMGMDKAMLDYHGKPQCYHIYEMLAPFCEKVFISCNEQQADAIDAGYEILVDLPYYSNHGPIAGILTALTCYSHKDFLLTGCDYPFLSTKDITDFLPLCHKENMAAAFYNQNDNLYEPMLAYYKHNAKNILLEMFEAKHYSLQHFLRTVNAIKFYRNQQSIRSIDTMEEFIETKHLLQLT